MVDHVDLDKLAGEESGQRVEHIALQGSVLRFEREVDAHPRDHLDVAGLRVGDDLLDLVLGVGAAMGAPRLVKRELIPAQGRSFLLVAARGAFDRRGELGVLVDG